MGSQRFLRGLVCRVQSKSGEVHANAHSAPRDKGPTRSTRVSEPHAPTTIVMKAVKTERPTFVRLATPAGRPSNLVLDECSACVVQTALLAPRAKDHGHINEPFAGALARNVCAY